MTNILVTAPFSAAGLDALSAQGHIRHEPWNALGRPHTTDELLALVREHSAEVLVVEIDPVERALLESTGLKIVGCCRAGLPNIDVDAARELGVRVLRTPGRNAQAVAEYVIGALISHLRNIPASVAFLRGGEWGNGERPYLRFRGGELSGRTVTLHGYGAVARKVAHLLRAFGCEVLAIDPFVEPESVTDGTTMVNAVEGYRRADILSIHLPVTPSTTGAVSRELLELLPTHAIVVNSARAAVLDYDALTEMLAAGHLGGAVVDVYRTEPLGPVDAELIAQPNVLPTPHIAGATHEVVDHHSSLMVEALEEVLAGREPEPAAVAV